MARASVFARTGLVGHPSDGYGGATLSATLANFAAEVQAEPAPALEIVPACDGQWHAGGRPLIAAAVARFAREHDGFEPKVRISYRSTIPRQLGLGGSSAIVIATLRALAELHGTPIDHQRLPALALSVETELGIAAGLQDRVVQTRGGLVFMDFVRSRHTPMHTGLLPELFIAWRPDAAGASGAAHAHVRERFAAGDRQVVAAMGALAALAHEARACLEVRDHDAFAAALSAGYDIRARIFELDERHTALVGLARSLGLPVTYTGSGGAIAGVATDADAVAALARGLAPLGARVARAEVAVA